MQNFILKSIESNPNVDYYVDTFNAIIHHIKNLNDDFNILFDDESQKIIDKFIALKAAPKKLIIRMYFRKSQIIKLNDIENQENCLLESEYKNLETLGFVDQLESLGKDNLWKMLQKKMIDILIKEFHVNCKTATTMEAKIKAIENHINSNRTIASFFGTKSKTVGTHPIIKRAYSLIGPCYKIDDHLGKILDKIFIFTDISSDLNFQIARAQTKISEIANSIIFNLSQILRGILLLPQYTWKSISFIKTFYNDINSFNLHLNNYSKFVKIQGSANAKELAEIANHAEEFSDLLKNMISENINSTFYNLYYAGIVKCCSRISDGLEVKRRYQSAIEMLKTLLLQKKYSNNYRGHWYSRLSLIYFRRLKKIDEALKTIQDSIDDPIVSEFHRYMIFKRCIKILGKNDKHPLYLEAKKFIDGIKSPPIFEISGKRLNEKLNVNHSKFETVEYVENENDIEKVSSITSVEIYVMNYYKTNFNYTHGIFGEGSPFMTIFGLLLWDIIFMELDDVFFCPFQIKPIDFFGKRFYSRRKQWIDGRLQLIQNGEYDELLNIFQKNWDKNFGSISTCVSWDIFSNAEEIVSLIKCIGSSLVGIFNRFLENMSAHRSGMPDLLLWNPTTGDYKIVEVKGPGDKPFEKQIIWFHHLMQLGLKVELCYVRDRKVD